MNKFAKRSLIIGAVLLLPAAILLLVVSNREPRYEGKLASTWFQELTPLEESRALAAIQKMGKGAIPVLHESLKASSPNDRYKAVWTLGQMGEPARESAPLLIDALGDTNNSVRYYAIQSLSNLKPDPENRALFNGLLAKLGDSNKSVSASAAELLNQLDEQRKNLNLPPFYSNEFEYAMAFVRSISPQVQLMGVDRLGEIQDRTEEITSTLKLLVNNTNESVRAHAKLYLQMENKESE